MIGPPSCDERIKGIRVTLALGKLFLRISSKRTSRRPRCAGFVSWTTP